MYGRQFVSAGPPVSGRSGVLHLCARHSRCRSQGHRARRGGPRTARRSRQRPLARRRELRLHPAAGAAATPLRGPSGPGPRQAARRTARGHGGGGASAGRPVGVGGAERPGCEPGGHGECSRCRRAGLRRGGGGCARTPAAPTRHLGGAPCARPPAPWPWAGRSLRTRVSSRPATAAGWHLPQNKTPRVTSVVVYELAHRKQSRVEKKKNNNNILNVKISGEVDGPWSFRALRAAPGGRLP